MKIDTDYKRRTWNVLAKHFNIYKPLRDQSICEWNELYGSYVQSREFI